MYIHLLSANCHLEWQNCLNCFLWFYGKKQARKNIEKTPVQEKWREWKPKVKLRLRKKTFELNSYAGDG